jgi:protease-4
MKKACIFITIFFIVLVVISAIFTLLHKEMPLRERVALVRIEGPIVSSETVVEELKGHVKDRSVKAIVIRIDSPGGGVVPSQEIYDEVKKAVAKKPVIVSMGAIAASGGYYIASPASRIIANPGTITGSIGVITTVPNIEELMQKIGIRIDVIKSGEYKDITSVFRGIEQEERKILQGVMNNVHKQFIKAVSESRGIALEEVVKIADGRIWTGEQAVQVGLVDELGSLEHAIRVAAEIAGIEGEPEVVIRKERLSLMDMLRGQIPENFLRIIPQAELKYMYIP